MLTTYWQNTNRSLTVSHLSTYRTHVGQDLGEQSPKYCLTVGHLLAKSWLTGFCTKTYNDSTVPSNGSIKMHLHGS